MCVDILVIRRGERIHCGTVGELAAALNLRTKKVSPDPFGCCLCNAYLADLGARLATDEEGFPHPHYIIGATP